MLKAIAKFSKLVAKYSYYPILLGFVGIGSIIANRGEAFSVVGYIFTSLCAVLCLIALLSRFLCRKAGIDEKIH